MNSGWTGDSPSTKKSSRSTLCSESFPSMPNVDISFPKRTEVNWGSTVKRLKICGMSLT